MPKTPKLSGPCNQEAPKPYQLPRCYTVILILVIMTVIAILIISHVID